MIHVYLRGERTLLERSHEDSIGESGVRLWNAFRGEGHPREQEGVWSYFEWSIGWVNANTADDAVRAGWIAFWAMRAAAKLSLDSVRLTGA